jgi:hypothetical protein
VARPCGSLNSINITSLDLFQRYIFRTQDISDQNFVIAVIADFDRYTAFTKIHHISIVIALAVLPLFPPFGLAGGLLQYRLLLPALFHHNPRVEYD